MVKAQHKEILPFTELVIDIIQAIPRGKVATYGQIAKMAGNPHGARQVVWILHSSTKKNNLPWHRVINSKGEVAINDPNGKSEQRELLLDEGVEFKSEFRVDLYRYLWNSTILKTLK